MSKCTENKNGLSSQRYLKTIARPWPVATYKKDVIGKLGLATTMFRPELEDENTKLRDSLPSEFFLRELLDFDVSSDDLLEFINLWGAPKDWTTSESTQRDARGLPGDLRNIELNYAVMGTHAQSTIERLQKAAKQILELIQQHDKHSQQCADYGYDLMSNYGVLVYHDLSWINENAFVLDAVVFDMGARRIGNLDLSPEVFSALGDKGGFTSAVCNQIIDWIKDVETPIKTCKATDCGRIFKYQRKSGSDDSAKSANKDAIYCSDRCRNRHKAQRRLQGIKLLKQGKDVEDVAEMLGVAVNTANNWKISLNKETKKGKARGR